MGRRRIEAFISAGSKKPCRGHEAYSYAGADAISFTEALVPSPDTGVMKQWKEN